MPDPTITATTHPFERRVELAFAQYLTIGGMAEDFPGLIIRSFSDPRDQTMPAVVVKCQGLRQEWPGSDEFRGNIIFGLVASRDVNNAVVDIDDLSAPHRIANQETFDAIAAQLEDVLTIQPTIAQILNTGTRSTTVGDIHFYGFTDMSPEITTLDEEDGCKWLYSLAREILIARCDYA